MMFGGGFKKPQTFGTPPIYDPTEGQSTPMPGPAEPAAKPGFFDRNGLGVDLLGGISDGVLALNGMQPVYAPAQQHRQDRRDKLQDASTARQQQIDTWIAQQQYKQAHPDPVAPHYWETNDGSLGVVGADGKPTIAYKDPTPKVDYTPVKNPNGTTTLYPTINGQMVGAGQPQPAAGLPQGFSVRPKGGAGSGQRPFQ